ncbi:hypothetical protein B9Z55_024501 [Caenorhabditis nigoni]|uniref:G-protein coupled receptors family 1 profile domain-containing protein n=1 Tax=Caenorhabditis nigoni TaxID=1611254 RepID=A0A2G5SUK2_9PELO|nr:hypothetical protein B9Z55_024501 [Caenorhabditis nigoni]
MELGKFFKFLANVCEYMFPFLAVLGIAGNIITMIVLLSRSMRSRTNQLLAAAALCDILYLVAMSPNQMSRWPSLIYEPCQDDPKKFCPTYFALMFVQYKHNIAFFSNWFSATSTWFIVAVSFDRLYAIKAPFSARFQSLCSRHNWITIPLIALGTGMTCFHLNFKLLNDHQTANGTMTYDTTKQQIIHVFTIIQLITHICVPVILLIGLNSCLIYYLRNRLKHFFPVRSRSVRTSTKSDDVPAPLLNNETSDRSEVVRHHSSSSGVWNQHINKAERHVTYTVIAIVTCYILSHVPSACLYVYIKFQSTLYNTKNMYHFVQAFTTLVTISKVANFLLFCMSSKHFRKEMKKKLCCLFCTMREGASQKESTNQPRTRFRSLLLNIIGDSTAHTNNCSHE